MKKVLLFSHENDIDGMGNVILAKLAFKDIDYILAPNVYELESKFRKEYENNTFDSYNQIFITDLALYNPSYDLVKNDKELKNKIKVFDHHMSTIKEGFNDDKFVTIYEADSNGLKTCGTKLFYDYLCENNYLERNKSLDKYVELTRLEDTWDWKNNQSIGVLAHDLPILFNIYGIEKYIDTIYTKLINNTNDFELTEDEQKLISLKKEEYCLGLEKLWSETEILIDENNNKYAAVYGDYEYRNDYSEFIKEQNIDDIKYVVIVILDKGEYGQKSYRSVDKNFNVEEIASSHGGGGHPSASSVKITKNQKEKCLLLKETNYKESLEYIIKCNYDNN